MKITWVQNTKWFVTYSRRKGLGRLLHDIDLIVQDLILLLLTSYIFSTARGVPAAMVVPADPGRPCGPACLSNSLLHLLSLLLPLQLLPGINLTMLRTPLDLGLLQLK